MYYFCRRLLVLDAVVLSFAWNKTFTGFLHKIQVTRCNLTNVESHTFTHVERLQAIDISQNQISYLAKESFFGLIHLVTINLESNLLSSLPDGIFAGLSSLENILLRQNRITCIDAMTFSNLHYLKRIDLSRNKITHISDEAMGPQGDYTQLTNIDLSQNELEDFPIWLLHLKYLGFLDLSHNRISFNGLKSVLSRIPTTEYITYGYRWSIGTTKSYFNSDTTKNIILQNNAFTGFDISGLDYKLDSNFKLLLNHFRLYFYGNPFRCNCNMYSLHHYFGNYNINESRDYGDIRVYNMKTIVCEKPNGLKGIPLMDVPIKSLGCYKEIRGCPRGCQCWVRTEDGTVKVICSKKSLTNLPESLPYNTTELDFSGNFLLSLPQKFPDYLLSIETLDLHDNRLTTLPLEVSDGDPVALNHVHRGFISVTVEQQRFCCFIKVLFRLIFEINRGIALQWRHNGHDSVSNHQPHDCYLNRLFRRRWKKTPKLRVTGLCAENSPGTGEFPAHVASYAENVSIWWRHHV